MIRIKNNLTSFVKKNKFFNTTVGNANAGVRLPDYVSTQVKKNKNVIYGAQSVKKQLGIFGRNTIDWDIMSKNPKSNAQHLTHKLNKTAPGMYYNAPSKHTKGVYKVYYVGNDGIPRTQDDKGIADYSKIKNGIKFVVINGIRYSVLENTIKDKQKALADKQYAFRHEKDRKDLNEYIKLKNTPVIGRFF